MTDYNKYGWDFTPNSNANFYIDTIKSYINDENAFKNFRRDIGKTNILEGFVGGGEIWLNHIKEKHGDSLLLEKLDLFKRNDLVGNPYILNYGIYGDVCPFTFKYILNGLDIQKFVGKNTKIKKIAEIGGGFGSMCIIMDSLYEFDEYIIVDLPDVIKLIDKYLSHFPEIYKKLKLISCEELSSIDKIEDIDILIADSSLAECGWDTQLMYFNKIIKNCNYGYIVYNFLFEYENFMNVLSEKFNLKIEHKGVHFLYIKK